MLGEGKPESMRALRTGFNFIPMLLLKPSLWVTESLVCEILGGSAVGWRQILGLPLPHATWAYDWRGLSWHLFL